ncbi:MAG: hypothetical protein U0640_11715 [Phycisphaerales bacterium]
MSTVVRKVHFKFENRSKRLVTGEAPEVAVNGVVRNPRRKKPSGGVPRIAKLMALAIRFDELLSKGVVKSQTELALLCHVTQPRMTQIMNLLHLAPDIQEQILDLPPAPKGRDPITERDLTCPPQPGPTSGTVYRGWTMEGMIDGKATIQRGADHSQVA